MFGDMPSDYMDDAERKDLRDKYEQQRVQQLALAIRGAAIQLREFVRDKRVLMQLTRAERREIVRLVQETL